MSKKTIISLLVTLSLIISLVGCGTTATTTAATTAVGTTATSTSAATTAGFTGEIKIGLISMVTGANPLNGQRMNQAVNLAVNEWNAKGGIMGKKIIVQIEDDATTQDGAVTAANKLISAGAVAIIGPHRSTNAMAVEKVIKDAGVSTFTGGTTPKISTLNNPFLFRIRASDVIFAEAAAKYAVDTLGAKKVGMFYNNDEYGTGAETVVKDYMAKAGITYVSEGHNTGDKDFTGQIVKMKSAGVDTMIVWTHDAELAIHARQMYELGLKTKVVSSPGATMQQVIDMVQKEHIEGWFSVSDFVSTSTDKKVTDFIGKFKGAYKIEPELYASSYYGAAQIVLNAIKNANSTDRKAIRDAVAKTTNLDVPNGIATCDATNDLIHEIVVAKLENKVPLYINSVKVG